MTGLIPQDERTAAAIEGVLVAIDVLEEAGKHEAAEQLADDLILYVFGPGGPPPESEARALWGDR